MFAIFTYVHCFPVIQRSECEPLGLYIGFLYLLLYVYMSLRPFSCVLLQIYIQSVYQTIHVFRHLIVAPFTEVSHRSSLLHMVHRLCSVAYRTRVELVAVQVDD